MEAGEAGSLRWLPLRVGHAFQEKIRAIWDDQRTASLIVAELTGDKYDISDEDYAIMRGAGLAHLFAVSGLHCAFLITLLGLLIPRSRQRLFCGASIAALVFYMCMVGMTPSVVRACVMQGFVLLAPLVRRGSDPLTSLGTALLVILLGNPFAAASISLQLSFAATFGIAVLSDRLYHLFFDWYQGKDKHIRRMLAFGCANLAVSLSAMICTVPLAAYYFNTLSLVSPLGNLLAVAGLCADPVAVPCGVFRQSLPAAVAGGDVSGLRPVRRGEEMAEAEVLVRRGGHPSGAGAGHLVQHPDLPHRQHERDGAGRGPG